MIEISGDWERNTCFENTSPPISIDLSYCKEQLRPIVLPKDWSTKASANRTALKAENYARLMGYVSVDLYDIKPAKLKSITAANYFENTSFNEDGEYITPNGQIPLSRIKKLQKCSDKKLLAVLYDLQCPSSSPWSQPFIRLISNHSYDKKNFIFNIKYFVYFSRLIFELIANDSIKYLMEKIEGIPVLRIPAKSLVSHPKMFESVDPVDSIDSLTNWSQSSRYAFSIQGILKYAENKGYPMSDIQPDRLNVQLYDFQRSTYQWMLDHERDEGGLNSYFWDEFQYNDGGGHMYYFPLAGEFRLTKPPKRTGGLLAEEMGLGKTVEAISIILGNPRDMSIYKMDDLVEDVRPIKTTLIVVPTTLIGQWWRELHSRIHDCGNETFQVINITDFHNKYVKVDKNDIVDFSEDGLVRFRHTNTPYSRIYEGYMKSMRAFDNDDFCEVEHDLLDTMGQYDIVLTTYEQLRSKINLYKKYNWYRIILDECQEIRVSTTIIANQLSRLSSVHRWMISGTPIHQSISDLNGELNFLKVWPFSLSDKLDGFWELKIQQPYNHHSKEALSLIYNLLDVVMMRHTKSQKYINSNRSLVSIPLRRIEYRGIELMDTSEKYLYRYIECFVANAIYDYKKNQQSSGRNNRNSTYSHIKSILAMLYKCILNPSSVNLMKLDHIKRMIDSPLMKLPTTTNSIVPFLTPEDILQFVRGFGQSSLGGLNRATNRVLASVQEEESISKMKSDYEELTIIQLKNLISNESLPLPPESTRKQPYVDLLMSKYLESLNYSNAIHDSGYSSLYKLISYRDSETINDSINLDQNSNNLVDCPLCLCEVTRPVVTKCVHIYCYDCIIHLINESKQSAKCPVCRRAVSMTTIMEADLTKRISEQNIENDEEEKVEDAIEKEIIIDTNHKRPRQNKNANTIQYLKLDDTEVCIPDLSEYSSALTSDELMTNFPTPDKIVDLNVNYPALDKEFLCYYSYWKDNYNYNISNPDENGNITSSNVQHNFIGPKLSSKLSYLLHDIKKKQIDRVDVKFVIYSQFIESLDAIQSIFNHLTSEICGLITYRGKLNCSRIDSRMSATEKEINLSKFHTDTSTNILLLTLGTAATGLTLTNASVCYIIEPTFNLADEIQAMSRIHRIGQMNPVHCIIFYTKNTIEEKILDIRNKSNLLINQSSLSNRCTKRNKRTKVSSSNSHSKNDNYDDDEDDYDLDVDLIDPNVDNNKLANILTVDQLLYIYGSTKDRYEKSSINKNTNERINKLNRCVYQEYHERMNLFNLIK